MPKNILRYVVVLLVFGAGIITAFKIGAHLYSDPIALDHSVRRYPEVSPVPTPRAETPAPGAVGEVFLKNLQHPLGILLLQIIAILISAKVAGIFFHKLFKLTVVGEMLAGLLLGPSLLGVLSPGTMTFLFPPESMDFLKLLSQIGVILFMFIVGTEFNFPHLRQNAHVAILVSHAGIIIPFFFGAAFSLLLYPYSGPSHISFRPFALFMSVSMSITAFPVLARIIEERNLSGSYIGTTAIACAAVDDATAWCLLAAIIAIVNADGFNGAVLTTVLALLFIGCMLFLVKPQVGRVVNGKAGSGMRPSGVAALALVFVFASALFTEVIGIHALFGAFVAGLVVSPHRRLRSSLTGPLQLLTSSFLLPLYFAFTGLRTQVGLLHDSSSWLMCAGVVLIAVAGKLGGGALAARLTGMSWYNSLTLGVLMNTRGLVELIVLNIGYDLGILNPRVYSMMVLMALITTFMTGPLLSSLELLKQRGVAVRR
jgi:Kef-type K+ transport system membrane component KefB